MKPRTAPAGATDGPLTLAAWAAMALMLASLPQMLRVCGGLGWAAWQMLGLHGLAMLLPAVLGWWRPGRVHTGTAAALAASGLCLWWLPGLAGLMLASLCQALACGLHAGGHLRAGAAYRAPRWAAGPVLMATAGLLLHQTGPVDPAWWVPLHAAVAALGLCALLRRVTLGGPPQPAAQSQRHRPWPRTASSAKPITSGNWKRCIWN